MLTDNPHAPLILIVEDDNLHISILERAFSNVEHDFRLAFAGTVAEARLTMGRELPDLVLTDYRLPDGDGQDLLAVDGVARPVVMMTSQGNEKIAVEAMKAGVRDYVVKSAETFSSMPHIVLRVLLAWNHERELKAAEEQIREEQEKFRILFENMTEGYAFCRLVFENGRPCDWIYLKVNDAFEKLTGLNGVVGRNVSEVIPGIHDQTPELLETFARVSLSGKPERFEIFVEPLKIWFSVGAFSPEKEYFVAVFDVITERKRAEEERLELERKFQQTQRLESLGVLAGGIAHDFNNILTIILGHCYVLRELGAPGTPDREHVRQIESAASRAADLCRQMLAYAGKSQLVQSRVNLWLLVDEIVKMLQSAIKKNVSIDLDLKRDVPEIIADSTQIQQIIMNLIINAAEAIGDDNGAIKVALAKSAITDDQPQTDFFGNSILAGRYACLTVADNGCGMEPETQKRIFEPFYTTKFTGRGLGMSAILGIIKSHNGALQLTSQAGVGTTFKVYLPLQETAETEVDLPSEAACASSADKGDTVLLVDDEESLRTIGMALLNAIDYEVITAANGREAVEIFRQRGDSIDLVMLDLIMPEMGGLEAYHKLRQISATVPVVICSGYGAGEVADAIRDDQQARFAQKPYTPKDLKKLFQELIKPQ